MLESKVLNFNPPIISLWNERRGRMCVESHVASGHLGSICYNSFRWKAARLFNNMPKNIRNLTVCSTLCFKKKLDARSPSFHYSRLTKYSYYLYERLHSSVLSSQMICQLTRALIITS